MIEKHYDTVIIGAGMAGLASAIRLLMFGKSVLLLEKHSISGGLNSYYQRGKRQLDVGLHAMTNALRPDDRGKPFQKVLKQLRIPLESFELVPQKQSQIIFPQHTLTFTNEFSVLLESINQQFPNDIDQFLKFVEMLKEFQEVNLNNKPQSAKEVLSHYIKNPLLTDMIFCPLMIYGSAVEEDMEFSQFVIMFKSIFFEGFQRPLNGVRTLLQILEKKIVQLGGEIHFKREVMEIVHDHSEIQGVLLTNGSFIPCRQVLSTAGYFETQKLLHKDITLDSKELGQMSFTESIIFTKQKPSEYNNPNTIVFFNHANEYHYRKPQALMNAQSGVLCFPNNFDYQSVGAVDPHEEGIMRVTYMANYHLWKTLKESDQKLYRLEKDQVLKQSLATLQNFLPRFSGEFLFSDVFTPTTIERYTGHFHGAVYGSPLKIKNGIVKGPRGIYLAGTDQGFLGIVGALLSGISITNLHLLQET